MKREMFINIIKSPLWHRLCYHSDDEFPWCKYADSVALWVSGGGGAVETLSTFSNIHNILPPDHHDHHYHTAAGESWAHLKTVGTNLLFSNFSLSVERLSVRDRGLDDNDHEHDDDIADDVDDAYDLTMDFTLLEKEGRPQRELMGEMEVFQTWQCHWCWCWWCWLLNTMVLLAREKEGKLKAPALVTSPPIQGSPFEKAFLLFSYFDDNDEGRMYPRMRNTHLSEPRLISRDHTGSQKH